MRERGIEFKGLKFYEIESGLTRLEARIMEQNLIIKHDIEELVNKINSIDRKFWDFFGVKY